MASDLQTLELALPTEYPEVWREIAAAVFRCLQASAALGDDDARRAMAITEAVADAIGGDTIYIPIGHFLRNDTRARALIADFNGSNLHEMARRHGYTPARAKQILREWAVADFAARQGNLDIDSAA